MWPKVFFACVASDLRCTVGSPKFWYRLFRFFSLPSCWKLNRKQSLKTSPRGLTVSRIPQQLGFIVLEEHRVHGYDLVVHSAARDLSKTPSLRCQPSVYRGVTSSPVFLTGSGGWQQCHRALRQLSDRLGRECREARRCRNATKVDWDTFGRSSQLVSS